MNKRLLATLGAVLIGGVALAMWRISPSEVDLKTPTVNTQMHGATDASAARPADEVVVPEKFSSAAQMGKVAFDANCSACHGANAAGTDKGPPLIHSLYRPGHHADFAFQRAAMGGVQAHHWRFGNMPPVEGVTQKQVEWITKYVREMQGANGVN
jgi:mono/diheme cytochrome c family protein